MKNDTLAGDNRHIPAGQIGLSKCNSVTQRQWDTGLTKSGLRRDLSSCQNQGLELGLIAVWF